MATLLAELEQQARKLPPDERARLAEAMLDSLEDTPYTAIDNDWNREIEIRVAAYERGEVQTFSAEDVFAEARRLAL